MPGSGLRPYLRERGVDRLTVIASGFGEAIAVGDGNAKVVEKLKSLRFRECAADDDGTEFAAKRCGPGRAICD